MLDEERLKAWLAEAASGDRKVLIKRLSANDTGATGGHQVGLYVPNRIAFLIAPELDSKSVDPRHVMAFRLDSHDQGSEVRLIYYNSKRRSVGTRNECRITGFGGRGSALQDPASTGAILVLSFHRDGRAVTAWVGRSLVEDEVIEAEFGPVSPGDLTYLGPDEEGRMRLLEVVSNVPRCQPTSESLPAVWKVEFPSPAAIVDEAARLIPLGSRDPDLVLMERYDCAYAMFQIVEEALWLPRITKGFRSIEEFLAVAQPVLQRRKARAGRNLEEHLAVIFREKRVQFSSQQYTEPNIRPDFVFPSIERYRDAEHGALDLDILAAKSTLRDRWPAVTREGAKVPVKHLFTMDEGISGPQFAEIAASSIRLVVPSPRLKRYPAAIRPKLWTLREFVRHRLSGQTAPIVRVK